MRWMLKCHELPLLLASHWRSERPGVVLVKHNIGISSHRTHKNTFLAVLQLLIDASNAHISSSIIFIVLSTFYWACYIFDRLYTNTNHWNHRRVILIDTVSSSKIAHIWLAMNITNFLCFLFHFFTFVRSSGFKPQICRSIHTHNNCNKSKPRECILKMCNLFGTYWKSVIFAFVVATFFGCPDAMYAPF